MAEWQRHILVYVRVDGKNLQVAKENKLSFLQLFTFSVRRECRHPQLVKANCLEEATLDNQRK